MVVAVARVEVVALVCQETDVVAAAVSRMMAAVAVAQAAVEVAAAVARHSRTFRE